MSPNPYQVGGSLAAHHPTYIERAGDRQLWTLLQEGQFCYGFNCRQMGKSSLRVRTMARLQGEGVICASVDMTSLGTEADPRKWYNGFISQIYLALPLAGKVALKPWLRERESLSPIAMVGEFISGVILTQFPQQRVVIFVDEIDKVLSLPFSLDDFFSYIRFCYNQRAEWPDYRRLSFALFGVATPGDLIQDKTQTPFNIGQAIDLTGFTVAEALPLAQGFPVPPPQAEAILTRLIHWTGGQPFLTQKLCALVADRLQGGPLNLDPSAIPAAIDHVIHQAVITHWESQDEPVHFRTIGDRLLQDENQVGRRLGLYQDILETGGIAADDSPEQTALRLTGVVVKRDSKLVPYNPLYQRIFHRDWVIKELNKRRPYAPALQAWVESQETDTSRLLRGTALQESLLWAKDKNLSSLDYRFLNASQQQEQQASQEANRILAQANVQAKRMITLGLGILCFSLTGAAIALYQAQVARVNQERTQRGTDLQRLGNSAQRQFTFSQLPALITALQAAQELQTLVKPEDPLDRYPAISPFTVLQHILAQIGEKNVLMGHQDGVTGLAISPQGDLIASVSRDRTLRLWTPQGQAVNTIPAHEGSVYQVAFSSDGQTLATAGQDQGIKLWNRSGKLLHTLQGHEDSVYTVTFSPDGQLIASGGRDRTVRIWDSQSGQRLKVLTGHTKSVDDVQFSPDGKTLATVCRDGQIRLWNRQGGLIRQFGRPESALFGVSWHPNGQELATAADDGTVQRWSVTGQLLHTLRGHGELVTRVIYSRDGQFLVSSSSDGSVIQWSREGQILRHFRGYPEAVFGLALDPQGHWLGSGAEDHAVRLWDLTPKPGEWVLPGGPLAAQFNGQTGEMVVQGEDYIHVFDRQGNARPALPPIKGNFTLWRWNPEGTQLVGLGGDRGLGRDLSNPARSYTWEGDMGRVYDLAIQPQRPTGEQWLAAATRNGTVWLWRRQGQTVADPQVFRPAMADQRRDPLRSIALHPHRPELLTGHETGKLTRWDWQTGQHHIVTAHGDRLNQVRYSPDGAYWVTASRDGTAKIWTSSGELQHTLSGDPLPVEQVAISPDSQWIGTATSDGVVRLWNPQGQLQGEISLPQPLITLDFADNQTLITLDKTGRFLTWPVLTPGDRLAQLTQGGCAWLQNYLALSAHHAKRNLLHCSPSP